MSRAASTPRSVTGLAVVVLTVAAVVGTALPAFAAPEADYEMPFPCGQAWTGSTRANHSPSARSIDWNRTDDLGDPVVAAAAGTVAVADDGGSGYGRWVMLDHGNGETTIYAHLSSLAVSAGQTVDQGMLLGTVGETGNATGPHLHFEERLNRSDIAAWFHGVA